MVASLITGAGTPEQQWRPFLDGLGLAELELQPPPRRAVVVAPHPDDEVLAVGGLLTLLHAAGTAVEVLAVTDGEASNPGGSVPPSELARRRALETAAALAHLGIRGPVERLGLPDGGREGLERPVRDALHLQPGEWLLAPWHRDGHPDHDAVGRACRSAAQRDGAHLVAFPIWAWHWASPDGGELPWHRAKQVSLSDDVLRAKAAALAEFHTQISPLGPLSQDAPVLSPPILARFTRSAEVVLT